MVKLEKKNASKKAEGVSLQKPLKSKDKKSKLADKKSKVIKEAVKPELVQEIKPQNGKLGKKNKKPETNGVSKKDKKVAKVEVAPVPVPKKEKKKAVPVVEESPVVVEKPAKKNKKGKVAVEVPVETQVVEVPQKKTKKGKAQEPDVEVVEPAKKNKKTKATVEETPTVEIPAKKAKKVKSVPEEVVPVKKGKKNAEPVKPVSKKEKKSQENGKPQQNGKAKKGKNPVESVQEISNDSKQVFDAPEFSEEDFNKIVTHDNIEKIVKALNKTVKKETESKKEIFTDYRYLLDVTCHKIPNCPKRMCKLTLKHPIPKQDEDDIVLFVRDLQRGSKVDYDDTIQHFDDLLRRNDITGVKVISFNQLKQEYSGYENKRKLANSFEHFLCDGRIVSHVVGFLGAITQKPRCTVHGVRMNDHNNIGAAIKKAIRRTAYRQINKGNMTTIPIASYRHTPSEVADNVLSAVKHLRAEYPGGLANVRSLNIKVGIVGSSSLPLYMSMVQGPETNPYVVGPREQQMLKLKRDTKDVLNKFQFTNEGKLQRLTQEQIAKKRKIQEGKLGEAVSEEVQAKKVKKEKKKKNKEQVEEVKEEPEVEEVEELVRLDEDEDSEDDGPVALVKEGEEFEEDDDDEVDDSDDFDEDDSDDE